MQPGLWQSSCPSARLIMQERHSRPPFILPGGEAVPACSSYHMAQAPPHLSSRLYPSQLGVLWTGVIAAVVERHRAKCSLPPQHCWVLYSLLHFVGCESKWGENRRLFFSQRDNNKPIFLSPARMQGPDNSSDQPCSMNRSGLWGEEGHTKGLAADISWKLLDEVYKHQETATAIVMLGSQWCTVCTCC